jgi:hypothetical protein
MNANGRQLYRRSRRIQFSKLSCMSLHTLDCCVVKVGFLLQGQMAELPKSFEKLMALCDAINRSPLYADDFKHFVDCILCGVGQYHLLDASPDTIATGQASEYWHDIIKTFVPLAIAPEKPKFLTTLETAARLAPIVNQSSTEGWQFVGKHTLNQLMLLSRGGRNKNYERAMSWAIWGYRC